MEFRSGQRVVVNGIGEGTIIKIRFDSLHQAIYTVQMDDISATYDGIFIARNVELSPL
jgi:hypothetical protein